MVLVCAAVVSACSSSSDSSSSTRLDDTPSTVQIGVYDTTVVEGADDLEFVISLTAAGAETISVEYHTQDGTAVAGTDFADTSGSLQFLPGELRKFVRVAVPENTSLATGSSKSMRLVLSNPQNSSLLMDAATGTIIDNNRDAIDTAPEYDAGWPAKGAFTNAAVCGTSCHESDGVIMDHEGVDVSPAAQWKHSVMANSFNDPYWQAAVEDEVDRFPHMAGIIEDTCTTCHAPMARTHAHHTGVELDHEGNYRFDTAEEDDIAREGVSCTLCHQIDAGNLGTADSFSGGYMIKGDPFDDDYKRIYGPYDSPVANNMNMQTGHRPTVGKYISNSELCATCHTLYTPALDPETGAPSGISFLEQGVFFEWQNSVYATGASKEAQCRDCHMPEPAAGYTTPISLSPAQGSQNPPPGRTPYGQHTLLGGNAHLLEILREYRSELGISNSTSVSGFTEQIDMTRDFMRNSTADISIPALSTQGSNLEFDIVVMNNAGHKIPTSYPSRRMWLHVAVKDAFGKIFFESGKPDARGYISTDVARLKADCMSADKLDGFDSSLCFEQHNDVIEDEAQIAIYETVLGDTDGNITHTLLLGAQYLKDNRIPPEGFTEMMASTIEKQTIPSGIGGDDDFNCIAAVEGCGSDTVHYRVDTSGYDGPYSVEARLLYQATQPAFVDGLHSHGEMVNRFKQMYDAVPPSVEVLAVTSR